MRGCGAHDPAGIDSSLEAQVHSAEAPMPDVFLAKLLDGRPAVFLRSYGADKFVVEVDGRERAVLRSLWQSLPFVAAIL
jgi:hypothetical protein